MSAHEGAGGGDVGLVVPVYRVERFVATCVGSLAEQTYRPDQVVLVDDRGGDASVERAVAAAEAHDLPVEVLRQPTNLGVSAARNAGLARLHTELVWFFDSDDLAAAPMLERLRAALLEFDADIAMCRTLHVDANGVRLGLDEAPYPDRCVTGPELALRLLRGEVRAYPPNKLFRRRLLEAMPFPEGEVYEDLVPMLRLILTADTVALVDEPDLRYRTNDDSISRNFGPHTTLLFDRIDQVHRLLTERRLDRSPRWRRAFLRFRYDSVILPTANMALRAAAAQGSTPLVESTVARARGQIRATDVVGLLRDRAVRQAVAAAVLRLSPRGYAWILARR